MPSKKLYSRIKLIKRIAPFPRFSIPKRQLGGRNTKLRDADVVVKQTANGNKGVILLSWGTDLKSGYRLLNL